MCVGVCTVPAAWGSDEADDRRQLGPCGLCPGHPRGRLCGCPQSGTHRRLQADRRPTEIGKGGVPVMVGSLVDSVTGGLVVVCQA